MNSHPLISSISSVSVSDVTSSSTSAPFSLVRSCSHISTVPSGTKTTGSWVKHLAADDVMTTGFSCLLWFVAVYCCGPLAGHWLKKNTSLLLLCFWHLLGNKLCEDTEHLIGICDLSSILLQVSSCSTIHGMFMACFDHELLAFSNLQQARRKAKTKDKALCPDRSTASNFGYAVPQLSTKKTGSCSNSFTASPGLRSPRCCGNFPNDAPPFWDPHLSTISLNF